MKKVIVVIGLVLLALVVNATDRNATSGSRDDVLSAYNAASDGDRIIIPAGSNVWYQSLTINKKVTIAGSGSNYNGTVIHSELSGQAHLFELQHEFCVMSNICLRTGNAGNGWLVLITGKQCMLRDIHFINGLSPIMAKNSGLVYNSTFFNGARMFRSQNVDPVNFASANACYDQAAAGMTNQFVAENCMYTVNSSCTEGFPMVVSSQTAGFWCVRHCDINMADKQFAPAFDVHGAIASDDPGVIAFEIYSNRFNLSGSYQAVTWVDQRGSIGTVYSNVSNVQFTDQYRLRVANQNYLYYFSPGQQITNSYYLKNYGNGSAMGFSIESDTNSPSGGDDSQWISEGGSYFGEGYTYPYSGYRYYAIQYPHYLRHSETHSPSLSGLQQ